MRNFSKTILFLAVLSSPVMAFTDVELENISIGEWGSTLNSHEKYIACGIWSKGYYAKGSFSPSIVMQIKRTPEEFFEK